METETESDATPDARPDEQPEPDQPDSELGASPFSEPPNPTVAPPTPARVSPPGTLEEERPWKEPKLGEITD